MRLVRHWLPILLILGIACFLVSQTSFSGTSTCDQCGARSSYNIYLGITFRGLAQSTAISRCLERHHLLAGHNHHWLAAAGAGMPPFGPMCGVGPGRYLWQTIDDSAATAFLDAVIRYTDASTADHYRRVLLDPRSAGHVSPALSLAEFPNVGFSDHQSFTAWWKAHRTELDEALAYR